MECAVRLILFPLCFVLGCPKVEPPATPVEEKTEAATETLQAAEVDPHLVRGQQFWTWYAEQNFQAIFDNSPPPVQEALTIEVWQGLYQQITDNYGAEIAVLKEEVMPYQGLFAYVRESKFDKGELVASFILTPDGQLVGAQLTPAPKAAESLFLDYQTKTDMVVPLIGEWTVYWGGRTVEQNYHAASSDQRFALDIVIEKDDKTHKTDGKTNEDYYAFGQPILAPGGGRVVSTANDVSDSVPGDVESKTPLGNHVIIDHGNGEFSFLAHFKQGSVSVAVGDEVTAGQPIAECGNSGRTSEPHLHYHLQTTEVFGEGEGLPIQFQNYKANGEPVERGELEQGQVISP